jgi:hypothetical protein
VTRRFKTGQIVSLAALALLLSACAGSPAPATPTAERRTAVVASPQAAASPAALQSPVAPAAGSPLDAAKVTAPSLRLPSDGQEIVVVDSTEGTGVFVRREPAGAPLRIWPDGSPMLVVGDDHFADGRVWRNVTTLDGQTGWVAAEYVQTADSDAVAAALTALGTIPGGVAPPGGADGGQQARVVASGGTPVPTTSQAAAPAAAAPTATSFTSARAPKPAAFIGQQTQPTAPPASAAAPAASTPGSAIASAPTSTPLPTATPIKAPNGARTIEVGSASLALGAVEDDLDAQIGSRPRSGMKLMAVQVTISNQGDAPFALYRSSLRLSMSDRSRVEPLTGGPSPLPYSTTVAPGEQIQGWVTFEIPSSARVDGLIWAPERDAGYVLGI